VSYLDDVAAQLVIFEGRVGWMYLDTRGLVTVDVGVMLPNVGAALKLPFTFDGRSAGSDEIRRDYARVKGMTARRGPGYYVCHASPRISAADGDVLLRARVAEMDVELHAGLPGYTAAPDAAKRGLLDMRYNLGETGLVEGYPHLCSDVEHGQFELAALACHRIGPSQQRNDWTAEQFRLAAAEGA